MLSAMLVCSTAFGEDAFQVNTDKTDSTPDITTVCTPENSPTDNVSPSIQEATDTNISFSLQGIGATLQTEDGTVKIAEIIPGGPADRAPRDIRLVPGDRIIAVAQEGDTEFTDILHWPLHKAVSLIRGKKGTRVRLLVQRADDLSHTKTRIVELERDEVKFEKPDAAALGEQEYLAAKRCVELGDKAGAAMHFKKGAMCNHAKCQYEMGLLCRDGNGAGVAKDSEEAGKWMTLSAQNGYAPAMEEYGCYLLFCKHDLTTATKWFDKAAENGSSNGKILLATVVFAKLAKAVGSEAASVLLVQQMGGDEAAATAGLMVGFMQLVAKFGVWSGKSQFDPATDFNWL